jgi:hypothetical protein
MPFRYSFSLAKSQRAFLGGNETGRFDIAAVATVLAYLARIVIIQACFRATAGLSLHPCESGQSSKQKKLSD